MLPQKEKTLFQIIEEQKKCIFDELRNLSPESLEYRRGPEKWNNLQILKHLMTSERLSLIYLKKKWSFNPTLKKAGTITELRYMVLKYANWTPIKLRAPKAVRINKVDESFSTIERQWDKIRVEMLQFLEELPEDAFKMELYKHPIAGKLSIKHMLDFFNKHIERHTIQIKNNISQGSK